MKSKLLILVCILFTIGFSFGDDLLFSKAQRAYDEGRYAESVMLYDAVLDAGVDNYEVHYNLGNASFKDSDLPKAVWHYRKAWYEAPRDPDIRANLYFALNAAGAVEPSPSFMEDFLQTLSIGEWVAIAVGCYLFLIILMSAALLAKGVRKQLLKLCGIPLAVLGIATTGWWHWHKLEQNPEWVVIQTEATALFGPVEGSTAHYKLPMAALVRQRSIGPKGWIEVEYDGNRGWLQPTYISQVSP